MRCKLFISLCFGLQLFAAEPVSFSFFQDKPQSLAKDFYIYEYLQRDETTPKEAKALFGMVHTMNMRFFHLFAKKMDNQDFKKISRCIDMDVGALLKDDDECLNIGISINKLSSLPKSQLPLVQKRLRKNPELAHLIPLMQQDDVFQATLNDSHAFLTLFNGSIVTYKASIFGAQPLDPALLDRLSKDAKFNAFVMNIVFSDKLDTLQKSLVHFNPSPTLKSKTLFYLGMNAVRYHANEDAVRYFQLSADASTRQEEKDKALFWQYLISNNTHYLKRLSESQNADMYTLYACEKLGIAFTNIASPEFEGEHPTFNINDPFAWPRVMSKVYSMSHDSLEALTNSFKYGNTLPHYVTLIERLTHYQKNYYPIPYRNEIKDYTIHRQALMLAIARQESRFIPSVVSTSYALGMMQFMPFVARDIAKKEKMEDFDISMMFDPKVAYAFGNIHFNYLEKSLYHPLFVAYAYNGGMGFTKKHLLGGTFSAQKPYEPFWSMEMMQNEESREYGKKVLANYVIYRKLLGDEVSLKNLFETLLIPSESDRFRN